VYLGPALLVRQGGWLLWDVPSQYGFLSELVIAALPLREVWRSLWLLNTLCVAGCASAFYLSCCALRAGLSQQVLSLALALTAVNGLIWGTAPQLTPSVGPYRFVWVYALLLLLGRESRRAPGTGPSRELRVAGNAVWVVGCLWSIESAVYCSSVWLPAWAVLTCCAGDAQRARNWLRLLPLASLAAALLLIQTIYLCGLGHGPDWRALTDFVMPYAAGIHSIVSDPHGAVWCLVFCFAVLLTALIEHWQRGATRAVLALHVGLCASVWSTATYFFARSLPGVAQVLGQVYALALVLALRAAPSDGGSALRAPSYLPRLALAALATLWLTTALATPETTFGALAHVCDRASGLGGTPVRLATDDENALLQRAGVRRDQPLAYAGPALLGAWRTADGRHLRDDLDHPALLPFTSFTLVAPLAPGRRAVYLARFVERRHTSGWLLVDEDYVDGVLPRGSLAPLLGEHYDLVPQGANDRRTLYWCRWRPLASSAARYERGVTPRAPRKTFVK
jgi:hypothetical protein